MTPTCIYVWVTKTKAIVLSVFGSKFVQSMLVKFDYLGFMDNRHVEASVLAEHI